MDFLDEKIVESAVVLVLISMFGLYVYTRPWQSESFETMTRPDGWAGGSFSPGDKRPQVPLSDNDFNPQNQDQPQVIDPQNDSEIETMDRDDLLKRKKSLLSSRQNITGVDFSN